MITGWPIDADNLGATSLATKSVDAPGGYGTTIVMP